MKKHNKLDEGRAAMLLMQHYGVLYGYLYACVGNHADAEDLLQQTSLIVTQKIHQLKDVDGFLPWARAIARLEVFNFRRKSARSPIAIDPATAECLMQAAERVDSRVNWTDRHQALSDCLEELPEHQREIIQSRYDGSVEDVAALAVRLKRTVSATYALLKRIKQALYECVELKMTGRTYA